MALFNFPMNSGGDPLAFHPPEEEDAEEVEEAPEEVTLRSKLVVKEDGSFCEQIEIGLFDFGIEIGEISEVILISEHEGRLVVAFPEQVWHRTAARRLLPAKCLIKPVLVSGTSGPRESVLRGDGITEEEVISMRIWVGILEPRFEEQIGFGEEADPVQMFGLAENPFLPLGQSLWEVVNDQFAFKSAESGGGGSKKEKPEERLRKETLILQLRVRGRMRLKSLEVFQFRFLEPGLPPMSAVQCLIASCGI